MAGKAIFRIRTMVVLLSPALEGKQTHAAGMVSSMGPTAPSGFLVPRIGKVYQQGDNPQGRQQRLPYLFHADIQFAQKTKTKIMKYREDNDSVLLFYEKRI